MVSALRRARGVDGSVAPSALVDGMNSRFRCGGCREYKPHPVHRRLNGRNICSDACAEKFSIRMDEEEREKRAARRQGRLPLKQPERKRITRRQRDDPPKATRNKVMERDRFLCRFDGAHTADHVHHIAYRSQGVDHSEHNLICLCEQHHALVHANKKKWQQLLRAVIWYQYVQGRPLTVLQVQRRLLRAGRIMF